MGVHNNIHVPKDSWPAFLWYAIEFFIVLGAGLGISVYSMDYFQKMDFDNSMTTWIFWGIIGVIFLVYYILIRPIIFRRRVLSKI